MSQLMRFAFVVSLFGLCLASIRAEDKKTEKLDGSYTRSINNFDIKMTFKDDKFTFAMNTPDNSKIKVEAKYKLTKGKFSGEVVTLEKDGVVDAASKGEKFSFEVELTKTGLKLSNLMTEKGAELKEVIEGEYTQAK